MDGFALALRPEEAALLCDGWPDGAWLVAVTEDGERRWDVGGEDDLPALVGTLPVWPPLGGLAVAEVAAEDEIALLRHLAAQPDLAAQARARLDPPDAAAEPELSAAAIAWDD